MFVRNHIPCGFGRVWQAPPMTETVAKRSTLLSQNVPKYHVATATGMYVYTRRGVGAEKRGRSKECQGQVRAAGSRATASWGGNERAHMSPVLSNLSFPHFHAVKISSPETNALFCVRFTKVPSPSLTKMAPQPPSIRLRSPMGAWSSRAMYDDAAKKREEPSGGARGTHACLCPLPSGHRDGLQC